ncbi:MAG: phosphatase PAP2 family protein, partial [Pseudomonadota bacterium]
PPGVLAADTFRLVGKGYTTGSFPSGHTFATFSVAGVLLAFTRQTSLRLLLLLGAAAIGLSRVFVGVHWPLDVIAGAAGGLLTATFAVFASRMLAAGFHPAVHLAMIALTLVSNGVLLVDGSNYLAADPMARVVAAASTVAILWQYLAPQSMR